MSNDLWYKEAVIYQLHVRSFQDSNGDGIGDFRGLIQRLDHFSSLGVTALWLLPFYISPLRDDGYDIEDYRRVNPMYGTIEDFQEFLDEAHARGLKVITELVLNHTSDRHAWFQRARRAAPGSPERDYYVWSDTPEKYTEARIIFKDFEPSNWTWDPVAKSYFWHRFYSHQPDLNFDNPKVHEEMLSVIDFWLQKGVDGVRLDAVPYLYEREGTNGENLPETHGFLKKLRQHVDDNYDNRMLLAEANQWPEDAAAYFGEGDECHMNFHFPLMPRLFMTIQMEDRFPLVEIMSQTPAIHENCQWAIFLRNHDELTLEMVTDEERDYMYRVYAEDTRARINLGIRRRLAPLMGNDRKKIELINSMLLSMPGTPIIYYGDEIGMGDNYYLGDRDGVRTPMQWSPDRNAGFSSANAQKLFLPVINDAEYHFTTVNVEVQERNTSSLLHWMRRMLQVRRQYPAFASGSLEFLQPENPKVVAFLRRHGEETLLIIANLSRHTQPVDLDLTEFAGVRPVEIFGRTPLPAIHQGHTSFTVGPYGFIWLSLQPDTRSLAASQWEPPLLKASSWSPFLIQALERQVLPAWMPLCRWFGGKSRHLREVKIVKDSAWPGTDVHVLLVEAHFLEGLPDQYVLPLCLLGGAAASQALADVPLKVLARLPDGRLLFDALHTPEFQAALFRSVTGDTLLGNSYHLALSGQVNATAGELHKAASNARVLGGEQSNTSISFADRWMVKFYRKFESGEHPEVEMTRHLTSRHFNVPPFLSAISLKTSPSPGVLAMLTDYTAHQGDGWIYTLADLEGLFHRVRESRITQQGASEDDLLGIVYRDRSAQLGRITAEMHIALADAGEDPTFAPQPFTTYYGRSLYQGMRSNATRVLRELRRQLSSLSEADQALANPLLEDKETLLKKYEQLLHTTFRCDLIRLHGDYHLGQVLNTGQDFVVIDFEGEPRLSLGERKLKRPALRDVAGMIRSFDYAACAALARVPEEEREEMSPWAKAWEERATKAYLEAYFAAAEGQRFLPAESEKSRLLLDLHVLDKALYEVGYELNYRPEQVGIPLKALVRLLQEQQA